MRRVCAELIENKVNRVTSGNPRKFERAWLSYKGFMVDALASRADEGRGMAAISFGEPRVGYDPEISEIGKPARTHILATALRSGTRRTETSKYPQEKKENSTPSVAASEGG